MNNLEIASDREIIRILDKSFRDQALEIMKSGLGEVQSQHPLDIPQINEPQRPTLGNTVPLSLYRAVRIMAFREVLGSKVSSAILNVSGRSVAQKMKVDSFPDLVYKFENLSVGKIKVEKQTDSSLILSVTECATCSGIPNIGEAICNFETGFMAGGLESFLKKPVEVEETQCWGLGDTACRWEANLDVKSSQAAMVDPLELVVALVEKTASAMDNTLAVRRKNRELREANRQIRESERLKKDLTSMIVHDMRVPLTAIIGSMETLSELSEPKLDSNEKELLKIALSSGQNLLQMINDLLDITKLEERKLNLKLRPTPLNELIDKAMEQINIVAKRKRLKLSTKIAQDLPEIKADKDRMIRVLDNLLVNAVNHTSSGGKITLEARHISDDNMVQISVQDTGRGIPKEYLNKIFDKFVQIDIPGTPRNPSTGLGLAYCKLVTEAHGGRIWVESEPGIGSTFYLTLLAV